MGYEIFIIPVLFLIAGNVVWINVWNYFVKNYPDLKQRHFPTGRAICIPPSELYSRETWQTVWPILKSDSGIMRRIIVMLALSAMFFLAFPIQYIVLIIMK